MSAARLAFAVLALSTVVPATSVRAVPPTRDEIVKWCTDAEGAAQCGRLIEEQQLKRLPGLATRSGDALVVSLFPHGNFTFLDVDNPDRSVAYSLWDNSSEIDAVVIAALRDGRTTYVLLLRGNGKRIELPAEPVLAPDHRHLVTVDACADGCSNEVVVWRAGRDDVVREASWTPAPAWSDAVASWKDADTLSIEYTAMGESASRSVVHKLGDAVWRPAR
jgi:hypothetical protein